MQSNVPDGLEPESKKGGFLSGRTFFGGILILLGVALLLDYFDVVEAQTVWDFWPLLLMLVGLAKLSGGCGTGDRLFGGLLLLVGTLLLLSNLLPDFEVPWGLLWPVAVIFVGLLILSPALRRRRDSGGTSSAWLRQSAFFGGGDVRVDSQAFRGGQLSVAFGGMNVDLRRARIEGEEAEIDLFVAFGGIDIFAPADWDVVVRATPILGGIDDERRAAEAPASSTATAPGPRVTGGKRLVLHGTVLAGGVDIKS